MTKRVLILSLSIMVSMLILGTGAHVQAQLDSIDIGTAADKPGTTSLLPDGTFTVIGAGHDVWDNADGFRYVYREISGDFQADVQVTFFERVAEWSKAGLMARQSVDAGAKNALSTAAAGDTLGAQITWRTDTDGSTDELDFWELGGPTKFNDGEWIRLTRSGDDFSASWSADGVTWANDYATVIIAMDDPILIGLVVSSVETEILMEARFKNFTIDGVSVTAAVSSDGKLSATWGAIKLSY